MRANFTGDKNVFIFKPVQKRKKFTVTNEEWLKSLSTEDLAVELAKIADWDKAQVEKARKRPGLHKFMLNWLKKEHKENE